MSISEVELCQGPRPTTKVPSVYVPAGSCDCHSHVLGPEKAYPYVADRSFTPPDASPTQYLAMLSTLGVDRAVIVQPSVYGADNQRTVDAVAELGMERARGVAMVKAGTSASELRALDQAGIRATRFITTAGGGPSLEDLPAVARAVAPLGWHIEMYVPPAIWPSLLPIVESLPVPVVFDHMGGLPAATRAGDPILKAILRLIEAERAWVKLVGYRNSVAGYPYGDVKQLARFFADAVPERCVWGSDWPHTNVTGHMPDDGELVDLFADWVPDEKVRKRILVDNPTALYRF
jgi:predicted TIM-barrel fold metal-dependent hydrolase